MDELPVDGPPDEPFALAAVAGEQVVERLGTRPVAAVVLGSGWQDAADTIGTTVVEVELADVAGFPPATALGHGTTVRRVDVPSTDGSTRTIAVFLGRAHLYEGHSPAVVSHAVRTVAAAGAQLVVLTNAAGTLRTDLPVGQPVLISDHLNATARSPLTGPLPPPPHRGRFVDLSDLYSERLRALARGVDPTLVDTVYAGLPGPHFETPAEIAAYRSLGADVLGFSTVLEAIAARHLGLEVLGISLVSNLCAGLQEVVDDEEVIRAGRAAAPRLGSLIRDVLADPTFLNSV
jgi:purine-nucleoside phosphorylase